MGHWFTPSRSGACSNCGVRITQGTRAYRVRVSTFYCEMCGAEFELKQKDHEGEILNSVNALLADMDPKAASGVLAATMRFIARRLDSGEVHDRDASPLAREIVANYERLKLEYPPVELDATQQAKLRIERLYGDDAA